MRAALALTGRRPSDADRAAVAADGAAVAAIVDRYLDSPEFGATMRDLHNEALLVRTDFDNFPAGFQARAPLEELDRATINKSLFEAPLALIEYVIMNDRPYTEIVTASYTVANRAVSAVWGSLPYTDGGPEWQITSHQDGRGDAGILSDDWLFSRHTTTISNANRGRANAVTKALLCYDFLDRDVVVDTSVDFADPEAVARAVKSNPACASCHHSLDPLAGFFQDYFPIYVPYGVDRFPFRHYEPGIIKRAGATVEEPAYFGQPGRTLSDLGRAIAADPRFPLCAAKRFYAFFNQVRLAEVPEGQARELSSRFVASGFSAKALARAIVLSDDFRVSYSGDGALAESTVGVKRAGPEQTSRLIEDLTGFRWTATIPGAGNVDLSTDSYYGYEVLAGGIDAFSVTLPSYTFNATSHLFLAELAARGAAFAVEKDFAEADRSKRKLLTEVGADDRDELAVRAQLAALHWRILAEEVEPGSDAVSESYALFTTALDESDDVPLAWKAVLTAMLQDFRVATY